jgi:hypothetical protein
MELIFIEGLSNVRIEENNMKITIGPIKKDSDKMLFSVKIVFQNNEDIKKTTVLTSASREYLDYEFNSSCEQRQNNEHIKKWCKNVIEKWSKSEDLFKENVHYDTYSTSPEGKYNCLNFLKN